MRIRHELSRSLVQTPIARRPISQNALFLAAIKLAQFDLFGNFVDNLAF